jgi:hypothetical protein
MGDEAALTDQSDRIGFETPSRLPNSLKQSDTLRSGASASPMTRECNVQPAPNFGTRFVGGSG